MLWKWVSFFYALYFLFLFSTASARRVLVILKPNLHIRFLWYVANLFVDWISMQFVERIIDLPFWHFLFTQCDALINVCESESIFLSLCVCGVCCFCAIMANDLMVGFIGAHCVCARLRARRVNTNTRPQHYWFDLFFFIQAFSCTRMAHWHKSNNALIECIKWKYIHVHSAHILASARSCML